MGDYGEEETDLDESLERTKNEQQWRISDGSNNMPNETYGVEVRRVDGRYEASIDELEATVSGATTEEALENAQREIIRRKIERVRARKPRGTERKLTVA